MSEQTGKVDDSQSPPKIQKKFRKGDLVKVDREKYSKSKQMFFVVLFRRSIFANSLGECILQKM